MTLPKIAANFPVPSSVPSSAPSLTPSLAGVATESLRQLLTEIRNNKVSSKVSGKLSRLQLQAIGLGPSADDLVEALQDLDMQTIATVIELILAERAQPVPMPIELVWTGQQGKQTFARQTAVVMRELFSTATRSILIAGFRFDHGTELFAPLHRVMKDRDVKVQLFVDVQAPPKSSKKPRSQKQARDLDQGSSSTQTNLTLDQFLHDNWNFGPPWPELYFDPRTAENHLPGQGMSMHAKCVVVDECRVLVGSANFTQRAQDRNYELGLLFEDRNVACRILAQWNALVGSHIFVRHR